jgi:pimeloyl-ACP methyl ester carboxylesterase
MINFNEGILRSSDGTTIGYLVGGSGPPLVMVHGGFTVADEWLPTAQLLAAQRTVYVMERRGRGRSGDSSIHSMQQERDDVRAMIEVAGPDADLFGHSYGGALSISYAMAYPIDGRLIIYEPPASFDYPVGGDALPQIHSLLDAGDGDEALRMAHIKLTRTPAGEIDAFRESPLWGAHLALLPTLLREVDALDGFAPSAEDLAAIRAETVLLLGETTQPFVREVAAGWLERLPGLAVLPIPGQSHICHLIDPPLMAERIAKALQL